jgi:hypothetical protein
MDKDIDFNYLLLNKIIKSFKYYNYCFDGEYFIEDNNIQHIHLEIISKYDQIFDFVMFDKKKYLCCSYTSETIKINCDNFFLFKNEKIEENEMSIFFYDYMKELDKKFKDSHYNVFNLLNYKNFKNGE